MFADSLNADNHRKGIIISTTVKFKKLHEAAVIPQKATVGSAGFDFVAVGYKTQFDEEWFRPGSYPVNIAIAPNMRLFVKTGLAVEVPEEHVLMIYARSGLATKNGIVLGNCVGVVDSDYRGEIMIALVNQSSKPYVVKNGERVAQGVIHRIPAIEIVEAAELTHTERGVGGFGSTGRRN